MTNEKYKEKFLPYEPRHAKQRYHVMRVIGPAGPVEHLEIFGLDEARKSTAGCWDWQITRIKDGKEIV